MISKKRKMSIAVIALIFACLFVLSAKGVYAAIDEEEPNDDRATANTIEMGTTVYGDTYDNWEKDYFKFVAPISGTAKLSVWTDSAAASNDYGIIEPDEEKGLRVTIYDSNANEISCVFDAYKTQSGTSVAFPVQCGKIYYLECNGSSSSWGNFSNYGIVSYHFRVDYSIGKTSIKSVRGKSGAFTVNWNKKSKASFYQVQYVKKSVYEDYGWTKAKKLNVASSSGSKTIRNLAKNKAYYVRVRVARSIEGVTYYSPWSAKKKVQTR